MKVKWDFVTNSSSTSYILRSRVSGHIPTIKNLLSLNEFYEETHVSFIYDNFAHVTKHTTIEEDIKNKVNFHFNNTTKWDDKLSKATEFTAFQLDFINEDPYEYDQLQLTKSILEELFFKQLKIEQSFQLLYEAHVRSVSGDGWDGGDPNVGPSVKYHWMHDLLKGETKMGILTVLNSSILDEVHDIMQQFSFNEMVLNNINTSGNQIRGTK